MLNNYMDGYAYYAALMPNVFDYRLLALAQHESLRNSEMFNAMIYTAPKDNSSLAAFDSLLTQVQCAPGSWLYGIRALQIDQDGTPWSFRVFTEPGRDLDGGCFRQPTSGQDPTLRNCGTLPYQPLFDPVCLVDGTVNVEISNLGSTVLTPQILLIIGEPLPAINSVAGKYCA